MAHLYDFHVVQSLLIWKNLLELLQRKDSFMLEMMLVLKNSNMQRILGFDPEPVETLRKLQRALDRGHNPQQFLEELLGDSMALEAEHVQGMNQPAHLSWEMEQLSEASSCILESGKEKQTLRGTAQELRGGSVTLQERTIKCPELQEENQQLRKQMDELLLQLQLEKYNSQEWESLTEELVEELEQLLSEVGSLKADRALQMAELEMQLQKEQDNSQNLEAINKELLKDLKQVLDALVTLKVEASQVEPSSKNQQEAKDRELEELYKLLEQLTEVQEALLQDHASLGALHEHLSGQYQALLEEHSHHKTVLRGSLAMESKAFRLREQDQLQHEAALQELRNLLSTERKALKQEQEANAQAAQDKQRLQQEVDRINFWNQLVKKEQKELCTQRKEMQASLEHLEQEVRLWQTRYQGAKEDLQSMEISLRKLNSQREVLFREKENLEEEKDHLRSQIETLTNRNRELLTENEDQARHIEKINFLPTTKAEEEETVVDSCESQAPVHKKKKRWMRARAIIKIFKRKNSDARGPAKATTDSPPETLEATPSCSKWVEERDTHSVPVQKAGRRKKNKKTNKDKSPAARPALLKRLQFWSSLDTRPPPK